MLHSVYKGGLYVLQNAKVHILDTESFDNTFGPKAQRKRPNIRVADMDVSVHNGCKWKCIGVFTMDVNGRV